MHKIGFIGVFIVLFQACQSNVVYNEYLTLENDEWAQEKIAVFEPILNDTMSNFDIFINLRNTKDYTYSNLFLITQITFPNKVQVIDTLEYEMTDPQGQFLGSGFSDIKENKLFYKENVRFLESGSYLFQIKQAMRKRNEVVGIDPLKGVKDVGISIEKKKE